MALPPKSVSCEVAVVTRSLRSAEKTARTNLKRKVTLKTIADHLGLTPGTVSVALNNSAAAHSISERRSLLDASWTAHSVLPSVVWALLDAYQSKSNLLNLLTRKSKP